MDSQYRKNLRAVATACKNYVDETKEQILWQVGQYNITTQDDNTTAYQKVVPTGATRVKIKSIGGMSYKCNNLANNPTITSNAKNDFQIFILLDNLNLPAGTYTISFKNVNTLNSGTRYYVEAVPGINYFYTSAVSTKTDYSITFTTTAVITTRLTVRLQYTSGGDTGTTTNVMLNSGSTALPYEPYFNGIRDSVITSVKSYDSNNNLIDTYTIPSEIQALEGYGRGINSSVYNVLDLDTNVFTDKDRVVDLGTGSYTAQYNSFYSYSFQNYAYQQGQVKFLCSAYKEFNYNGSLANFTATDKNITFTANNMVWITDKQYGTDTTTFKNNASGVKLQYELATYNITDNLELPDNVIKVEAGGYLVFENPYGQAVPSNITYRIEVAR